MKINVKSEFTKMRNVSKFICQIISWSKYYLKNISLEFDFPNMGKIIMIIIILMVRWNVNEKSRVSY